jgi:hypothetical protein
VNNELCSPRQVPFLLSVDDLAVGAITRTGPQWVINCVTDFCEEWSLKVKEM